MKMRITKYGRIRIFCFLLASVVLLAGALVVGYNTVNRYKTTIESTYQRAMNDLSDQFTELRETLLKGIYTETQPGQLTIASKLLSSSECAKSALSQLPVSEGQMSSLQKYLTQVQDFSYYIIGKLSGGTEVSKDDRETLKSLSQYAEKVHPQIEEVTARYADGSVSLSNTVKLSNSLNFAAEEIEELVLDSSFGKIEETFSDYPSLIYDGPFADQVQQKQPLLTKNAREFTKPEAKANAAEFLNVPVGELVAQSDKEGNIPCYVYEYEDVYISVTKNGGYICEMYKSKAVNEVNITHSQASEKASAFLKMKKLDGFKESYYVTAENVCTFNMMYKKDGVKYYPDLIKVGVSLETGEIVSFNASGYIMNHHSRELDEEILEPEEISKNVSEDLKIKNLAKAVIPKSGKEIFCYELTCICPDDRNYLVYINAVTGMQEDILILLQSDGGTLVI